MILACFLLIVFFVIAVWSVCMAVLAHDEWKPRTYKFPEWQRERPIMPAAPVLNIPVGMLCKAYCRGKHEGKRTRLI